MAGTATYNDKYYQSHCGVDDYYHNAEMMRFFDGVAKAIVETFAPRTVLDVGCACGHLVKSLRKLGVLAYGVDFSDDALNAADTLVRPYLARMALPDNKLPKDFPAKYDLVTNIEVLEHIERQNALASVESLTSFGDTVLFSSTPFDRDEPTHINVNDPSYWCGLFEEAGFHLDSPYCFMALCPQAMVFRRGVARASSMHELIDVMVNVAHKNALEAQGLGDIIKDRERVLAAERNRLEAARREFGATRVELDRVCCELMTVRGELTATRGELTATCRELTATRGELTATRGELTATRGELTATRGELTTTRGELTATQGALTATRGELTATRGELTATQGELTATRRELTATRCEFECMRNSTCWRMTKPIRVVLDAFKTSGWIKATRGFIKQFVPYGVMRIWLLRRYDVKIDEPLFFYPKVGQRIIRLVKFSLPFGFSMMVRKPYYDSARVVPSVAPAGGSVRQPILADVNRVDEKRRRQEAQFKPKHVVSILVPLYNTSPRFLRDMIDSVRNQTCGSWELCLGDASDGCHKDVSKLARMAARDSRIKYLRLEKNGGISANTNAILPLASGDVIALLDHDDLLHPSAVYKVLMAMESDGIDFAYTDELTFADEGDQKIVVKNYKPDYSPDYLRSVNYICHFSAFRRSLLDKAGGLFDSTFDGSQDHDLFLRLTGVARGVAHIPELLYFWRAHAGSTAKDTHAKEYVTLAGCRAVAADLERRGWKGVVEAPYKPYPSFYRIHYEINPTEKVSIVIPTKNHVADLRKCLTSIFTKSTYRNYEIVILDNGSTEPELKAYYKELEANRRVKIIFHDVPFNFSEINNFAVRTGATGKYLLFLNNDTEVIEPGWIEEMQMYAQRPDVGCVGAKLFYPDDTIQHAGVILGTGGVAGHAFLNAAKDDPGCSGRLISVMNYSIVTAACMMVRRDVFDRVGGFYEGLAVAFNDVDFCLKVRKAGYLNVWTPHATLHHYESKSRGAEDTEEKQQRFLREIAVFKSRWQAELDAGDPYYNVNLRLDASPFTAEKRG